MDAVRTKIVELSTTSDNDLKKLKDYLRGAYELIKTNEGTIGETIATLDPAQHSLGVAHLLSVQLSSPGAVTDQRATFLFISDFLRAADKQQAEKGFASFMTVCHFYAKMAQELGKEAMKEALGPLLAALEYLRPSQETWTPVHTEYIKLCAKCQEYQQGAALLDQPVFNVPSTSASCQQLNPATFISYFVHGAQIRAGLGDFAKAKQLLIVAMTYPGSTKTSASGSSPTSTLQSEALIEADAYKRYALVCLKMYGEIRPPPAYASLIVQEAAQQPGYVKELATAFQEATIEEVRRIAEENATEITEDDNRYLVEEVIQSYTRHKVQLLKETYLTLSLSEIAEQVGVESAAAAEALLADMIAKGEIAARIDKDSAIVFFDEEEAEPDEAMVAKMQDRLRYVQELTQRVAAVEEEVVNSEAYIRNTTLAEATAPAIREGQANFDFMDM
mmetsp:Transcript_79202/g.164373  ORF Transcript_79202/g.164373 Transcript_79202/m.164373 type:complete len:447 (-) Transcript_79202:56-1396(-)